MLKINPISNKMFKIYVSFDWFCFEQKWRNFGGILKKQRHSHMKQPLV